MASMEVILFFESGGTPLASLFHIRIILNI